MQNIHSIDALSDSRYLLRTSLALLLGIVVSGALVWFMYALIQSGEKALDDSKRVQLLDFVRLKREEVSQRKQQKPKRPMTSNAPPVPSTPQSESTGSGADSLAVADMSFNDVIEMDMGGGFAGGDGEFLPVVKVAPVYPLSARSRGIEGTCMVQYTVTTTGTTKDIRVVEGQCEMKVFRRPSVDAAKKFRYKPRVVDGVAVEVPKIFNLFTFELEN